MVSFKFQKGSPYIEDFDFLIDMKDQMGLEFSGEGIANYVPNATRCMRWEQVKASHAGTELVIRIEQIFGMLLILSLGFVAGFVAFITEGLTCTIMRKITKNKASLASKRAWKNEEKAPIQDSEAAKPRRFWLVAYE